MDQASGKDDPTTDQPKFKHDPCKELDRIEDDKLRFWIDEWLAYKRERKESPKPTAVKTLVTRVMKLADKHGVTRVADSIETAMTNGWKGFDRPDVWAPTKKGGRNDRPTTTDDTRGQI